MEQMTLQIMNETMAEMQKKRVTDAPFKLIYSGKSYPCNPEPAIKSANLVFGIYEQMKSVGSYEVTTPNHNSSLQSIIGFIHGQVLLINETNVIEMKLMSTELGIPMIYEYASQFLLGCGKEIFELDES